MAGNREAMSRAPGRVSLLRHGTVSGFVWLRRPSRHRFASARPTLISFLQLHARIRSQSQIRRADAHPGLGALSISGRVSLSVWRLAFGMNAKAAGPHRDGHAAVRATVAETPMHFSSSPDSCSLSASRPPSPRRSGLTRSRPGLGEGTFFPLFLSEADRTRRAYSPASGLPWTAPVAGGTGTPKAVRNLLWNRY